MARINTPVWLTLAATIFVAAHASALETLPGEPPVEDRQQAIQEKVAPSDERLASGRVVAVDRAGSRITLEYRPIPQLFLEGGTRIFHVGDPTSLKGLGPRRQGALRSRARRPQLHDHAPGQQQLATSC